MQGLHSTPLQQSRPLLPTSAPFQLPAASAGLGHVEHSKTHQVPGAGLSQPNFSPRLSFFLLKPLGWFTLMPMSEQLQGIRAWESFIC